MPSNDVSVDVTDARSEACELAAPFESNIPFGTDHEGHAVRRHACLPNRSNRYASSGSPFPLFRELRDE